MTHATQKILNLEQENKSNYLKENKLEKIKKYQDEIFAKTQIRLSTKKIIHELITDENMEKIKDKLMNFLGD